MKLATYKDGSRDGQLVVVSRDLSLAHHATGSATRLQQALDDWAFIAPQLQDLYVTLNQGKARHAFPFDPRLCMAPLPRAYQKADGAAYLNHARLLHQARGEALPASALDEPLMTQAASGDLQGAWDAAWFGAEAWGIDFSAELAVITGDVAMGASPGQALDGVRLLLLSNGWRLRQLQAAERAAGHAPLHGRPAAAFSPVAVTPDELGEAWQGGRVKGVLQCSLNGQRIGLCETGPEMHFHFGALISHLAKTRNVRAGAIVGSGTVSNADATRGFSCLAEKRAMETIAHGEPRTPYLGVGDVVRIEMKGPDGLSLLGAIEQRVGGPADLLDGDGADDAAETRPEGAPGAD